MLVGRDSFFFCFLQGWRPTLWEPLSNSRKYQIWSSTREEVSVHECSLTSFPSSSHVFLWCLRESWMAWICMETADRTASSKRLNSSKQPHAPHFTKPTKILPIDFTSIPCKTDTNKKVIFFFFGLPADMSPVKVDVNAV